MIFVDTNVFMYAVGRPHPLADEARAFFRAQSRSGDPLATSAEVLQELLNAYLPVRREETLDAALRLLTSRVGTIWPLDPDDLLVARTLASKYPALAARDLVHLACCRRRGVDRVQTFDRGLAAAFAA